MVTILLVLVLIFFAFGLGVLGCFLAAAIGLSIHVLAPDLSPLGSVVVAALVALIPVTAGLSVMLVERLSESNTMLKSLRSLVVLLSLSMLLVGTHWLEHLTNMLAALREAEVGVVSALLVSGVGSALFCSAATALAVSVGQFACQAVVLIGARVGKVQLELPWGAARLMGALLISGASLQLLADLYSHEFSPRHLITASKTQGTGK